MTHLRFLQTIEVYTCLELVHIAAKCSFNHPKNITLYCIITDTLGVLHAQAQPSYVGWAGLEPQLI